MVMPPPPQQHMDWYNLPRPKVIECYVQGGITGDYSFKYYTSQATWYMYRKIMDKQMSELLEAVDHINTTQNKNKHYGQH